jgi:hypothetical protein
MIDELAIHSPAAVLANSGLLDSTAPVRVIVRTEVDKDENRPRTSFAIIPKRLGAAKPSDDVSTKIEELLRKWIEAFETATGAAVETLCLSFPSDAEHGRKKIPAAALREGLVIPGLDHYDEREAVFAKSDSVEILVELETRLRPTRDGAIKAETRILPWNDDALEAGLRVERSALAFLRKAGFMEGTEALVYSFRCSRQSRHDLVEAEARRQNRREREATATKPRKKTGGAKA